MNANESAIDTLTRLVQAVGGDSNLRQWFCGLAEMSTTERHNEIFATVERMTAGGEDVALVTTIRLLADPRVFQAVRATLRECGYVDE